MLKRVWILPHFRVGLILFQRIWVGFILGKNSTEKLVIFVQIIEINIEINILLNKNNGILMSKNHNNKFYLCLQRDKTKPFYPFVYNTYSNVVYVTYTKLISSSTTNQQPESNSDINNTEYSNDHQ